MTEQQPYLPGMAPIDPVQTPLETAAHVMLEQLRADELLKPQHALVVQLVLDLARAIGLSATKGRAAAMALAAKELREALALLPAPEADDAFAQLMQEIANADR